jgi:rubrerythrin
MFNCNEVSKISIKIEEFISMFKEDSKTERILNYLQTHTAHMLKTEAEKFSNRCESAPVVYSRDINSTNSFSAIYCSTEDYIKLIKTWWKDLKPLEEVVHVSKIGDFLAEKNVVSNKHEGIRVASSVSASNLISYIEFEKIFLKAIFKASLINLASSLNSTEVGSCDASLRLKLSNYQRNLMIKGNDPDYDFKLGRTTLQAISKYQKTQPDTYSTKITKKINSTVANAEINHKDKIKAYLYKVKEHAKDFINDKGEVVTNLKNIWDIRDIINTKMSKKISTVLDQTFKEQEYINQITKLKKIKLNKLPLIRKIKVFRENYTLEKYQKMLSKSGIN